MNEQPFGGAPIPGLQDTGPMGNITDQVAQVLNGNGNPGNPNVYVPGGPGEPVFVVPNIRTIFASVARLFRRH